MPEPSPLPIEPETRAPAIKRAGRRGWQFGLRTAFLATAATAVWMADLANRRHNAQLEIRINSMRPLARELEIDDATKVALVKLDALWSNDNRWDVYLPGGAYRLCLATREVGEIGLAPVTRSEPIEAGRHRIELGWKSTKSGWRVSVTNDGATLYSSEEPPEWNSGSWSSTQPGYETSTQRDPGKAQILFRCRFMRKISATQSTVPSVPNEGILLWLEPIRGSKSR